MGLMTNTLRKLGLYHPLRNIYWHLKYFGKDTKSVFTEIYHENQWKGGESRSGQGSSLNQTKIIIESLPEISNKLDVISILDIPCGDFNWMSRVQLGHIKYTGGDIVPEVIKHNLENFGEKGRSFICINLIEDLLPNVDLVFCRDCLVHLPFKDIRSSINNIKRSGARYLMTTTFVNVQNNHDIAIGDFRPLNFERAPFNFPTPLLILNEGCTESNGVHLDKSLGIWKVFDLPDF